MSLLHSLAKSTMTVRAVTFDDIPVLTEFWYDQMALASQKHPSIRLASDAEIQWRTYAESLVNDKNIAFLLAEIDNKIIACAIGRIQANNVGLHPKQIGIIEDIILDLHSPHKRKNAVTDLLKALKIYFRQMDIQYIMIHVPTFSLVEQGFWRGLGLQHTHDTFWMDLST